MVCDIVESAPHSSQPIEAVGTGETANKLVRDVEEGVELDESRKNKLKKERLTLRQKLTVIDLCFCGVMCYIIFSVISPFFPGEAINKGISVSEIGLIFAVYEMTQALFSLLAGVVMHEVGPKFVFVAGLFIRSSSDILFSFLLYSPDGQPFFWSCFVTRAVEGAGAAAFLCASFTIVMTEFPDRSSSFFGLLQFSNTIGLMCGPPVGGALYEIGGFQLPFISLGCGTILAAIVSIFLIAGEQDSSCSKEEASHYDKSGAYRKLLSIPMIWVHIICVFVSWIPYNFYSPLLELHMEPLLLRPSLVGLIFFIQPLAYGITCPLVGWLIENTVCKDTWIEAAGYLVLGIGVTCLGPPPFIGDIPTVWLICLGQLLCGVGASFMVQPAFKGLLNEAVYNGMPNNRHTCGLISGVFSFAWALGAFIGPLVGAPLTDAFGFPLSISSLGLILSIMGVSSLGISIFLSKRRTDGKEVDGEKISLVAAERGGRRHYSTSGADSSTTSDCSLSPPNTQEITE